MKDLKNKVAIITGASGGMGRVISEMLADKGKKCSAARVYINGNYAGKYVNNDGTDPEYPSGVALNNENKISIIGIGDTKATMKMRHFRFAYYG